MLFFIVLLWAVLAMFGASVPKKKLKVNYVLLGWIFCGALFSILAYQSTWQLGGMVRPDFVKFMRTYNQRENAAQQQSLRGPLFDRRGMVLAAPQAGSIWKRRYPLGEAAVHPLGYYHFRYGITAVERACDARLSGMIQDTETLAKSILVKRAEQGESVTLTLDSRLQKLAYELLKKRRGAVVIMNPRNGELLALVSSPGFNPQNPEPALRDSRGKPVFNRAVQGRYPPGSTFKIITAGAALNNGISPTYNCPAGGYIAGRGKKPIRDSEYYSAKRKGRTWRGWGKINMKSAMTHSSNVYFSQLGASCTEKQLADVMQVAQLDQAICYLVGSSGDLKCASGTLPELDTKWERAQAAIGQGDVLVSPLHVACYTSAAANRGVLYEPKLNLKTPAKKLSQPFTAATAYKLKVMLREVVTKGTGKGINLWGLDVCGKTGTAEVSGEKDHSWFTCFAPLTNPEIVVTVLIENGGYGAAAALPVAKELLLEANKLGLIKGSKRSRK
ncbi:MAG: penicillin-binding transpeptidase domain-containing protein [Kiritimatiellae bacterium]|nr:penicillin-binding transpeptidase domain-containing protein [Kiritimatiellia bacterium]